MDRGGGFALMTAVVLLGCPANDTVGGIGETGDETGGPIPADPFDGEGSDPPGDPDPTLDWPQPLPLGNGLVHDSRYDLQAGPFNETFTAAQLVAGVDWAGFVDSHALKLRNGFRPTQVDAAITMKTNQNGTIELVVIDRSVYVSDDDANYKTKIKTFLFGNTTQEEDLNGSSDGSVQPRPTSIDTFALPGGRVGATVALVYDDNPIAWELVVGQNLATFENTISSLASRGYRPISIASRRRNAASEYAAIFLQDYMTPDDWGVLLGQSEDEFAATAADNWDAGHYPFGGTQEQGTPDEPRFNMLWTRRSPGIRVEMRYHMNENSFVDEDSDRRRRGFHLESAWPYESVDGLPRHAGIWVQHEPYMRWQDGVVVDVLDPAYPVRYEPFHQQAMQAMTRAGTSEEGQFFRPSATLHIFEGGDLVVNRAYTYAGATYPDTPLSATMAIASASKSITAAAVVMELQKQGIPLAASFAAAAGINNVPAMAPVTIADVLRNRGGFNSGATSYRYHSLIDASPYGEYPISGEMMYDYVVQGGHLDIYNGPAIDLDSYWNLTTYTLTQPPQATFRYSNVGFSMLGELVRLLSGQSYEEYVRTNLLAPLNLDDDIYPDRGHRNAASEPTQAGQRSYLINDDHAYNPVGCSDDSDCGYLVCDMNDPNPGDCVLSTCGPDQTCLGCAADGKTCRPGWDCVADACVNTIAPFLRSEPTPTPNRSIDSSPLWSLNAGPPDSTAPATAADLRYAGSAYMGGAPLAAGGWHADGESLGVLIRVLAQSDFLMPRTTAAQLWSPTWLNPNQDRAGNWFYGLGWYVRGNWIAMAGGSDGSMSIVLHNRAYDFTVVYLSNVIGNGFGELLNPLLGTFVWSPVGTPCPGNCSPSPLPQSVLGGPFPCIDDLSTQQNECLGLPGPY
jgi:CubicO group peptidase (beta-lactamase class C family)